MNKKNLYRNAICKKGNFIDVNIILMQKLGLNEAIIIPEIIRLKRHFTNLNALTDDGYFFATYEHFADKTGLTKTQVIRAIHHLEILGIIKSKITLQERTDNGEKKKVKTKYYNVDTTKLDTYLEAGDGSKSMNTLDPGDDDEDGSWLAYSKILAKQIGPEATIIFSDIYTTYSNYEATNSLVDGEWFPSCQVNLAEKCGVTEKTICKSYIPKLINVGLIDKKQMGFPKTSYARINWAVFEEMMGYTDLMTESNEEKITKRIIQKVYDLSGQHWTYNHHVVGHIENRIKEGITEQQILDMLEYKYNDYKDDPDFENRFNFGYLCGSRCKSWIDSMNKKNDSEEYDSQVEAATKKICQAIKDFSGGEYDWEPSDARKKLIKSQLTCGVGVDELIKLAETTYNRLIDKKCCTPKYFNWKALFDEYKDKNGKVHSCFDNILRMRRQEDKEYREKHSEVNQPKNSATYNPDTKKFKMSSNGTKDNLKGDDPEIRKQQDETVAKNLSRGIEGVDIF